MIVENAQIWTGDASRRWAEALWVNGPTIAAVGTAGEVMAAAGPGAGRVDLGGRFLCPGLVDGHAHLLGQGLAEAGPRLEGADSLREVQSRLARWMAGEGHLRGDWLVGRGWDQNEWREARFPTRTDLDAVIGDVPACLSRVDGHAVWVNTAALRAGNVTASTPDPQGGRIHRDAEGHPTGILVDAAQSLVLSVLPPPSASAKREAIAHATRNLVRHGLTGIHDMGMSAGDVELYRDLADRGALPIRVYGALEGTDPGREEYFRRGPDRQWRRGRFKLGMVKLYADGALGSRGAALLRPYSDDPSRQGFLLHSPEVLRSKMKQALEVGFQCAVHAIGDRANRTVLDAWEEILTESNREAWFRAVPAAPLSGLGRMDPVRPPLRMEHVQVLDAKDRARLSRLGVVASVQPVHCIADMDWVEARLGSDRAPGTYFWRSLVDAGVVLVAGSDAPVESPDPRMGLFAAVTRRKPGPQPSRVWFPGERLSREDALTAFTAAPAYVSGDLDRLGTLSPGKEADFVVFDRNLVTCDVDEIPQARVEATVVGGQVVWSDPEFQAFSVVRKKEVR